MVVRLCPCCPVHAATGRSLTDSTLAGFGCNDMDGLKFCLRIYIFTVKIHKIVLENEAVFLRKRCAGLIFMHRSWAL